MSIKFISYSTNVHLWEVEIMNLKRLSVDIQLEIHKRIKVRSAIRNISMTTWITRALLKALREEEKRDK